MLHQDFVWETAYNYTERREIFKCDFGPRNGAENIRDIDGCFEFFFNKEIAQQIFRETYTNTEQYKRAQGSFFSFRSFVRSWTPARTNKIFSFMSVLRGTIKERGREREREREREISAMAFTNVITGEIFELICTYLHLQAPRVYQHTKDLANF
jgi:hypothetical protein